jgi:hypothetical protein
VGDKLKKTFECKRYLKKLLCILNISHTKDKMFAKNLLENKERVFKNG